MYNFLCLYEVSLPVEHFQHCHTAKPISSTIKSNTHKRIYEGSSASEQLYSERYLNEMRNITDICGLQQK